MSGTEPAVPGMPGTHVYESPSLAIGYVQELLRQAMMALPPRDTTDLEQADIVLHAMSESFHTSGHQLGLTQKFLCFSCLEEALDARPNR